MRILILNQFYVPDISPTAHLAASLAEDRAGRGDEVTVLTSHGGYVAASGSTQSRRVRKVRIKTMWTPRAGKITHFRRLVDYASYYLLAMLNTLMMPKQDVIVSMTTPPFIALAGVLHKAAHPETQLVLWNMDSYPDVIERYQLIAPDGFISQFLRRVNRLIFQNVDYLVGLDEPMLKLIFKQYAPAHMKSCVIPNWEKLSLFSEFDLSKENQEGFKILYTGNAGFGHDFETVLDAAEQLQDEGVCFHFHGGGSRWHKIVEGVQRRQLKNVSFDVYGAAKEKMPELMADASAALITLRDDALGLMSPSKMHANLAMGLPIIYIGPKHSNVDVAIERFGCGVSLRHGQADELAARIREMMADSSAYFEMRKRARKAFESAYCDAKSLALFDAVLRN